MLPCTNRYPPHRPMLERQPRHQGQDANGTWKAACHATRARAQGDFSFGAKRKACRGCKSAREVVGTTRAILHHASLCAAALCDLALSRSWSGGFPIGLL